MIIYGHRNKEIEQNTGIFQCPYCGEQRACKRIKVVRYFTLFFIPLFPLGTLSEFIECQVCRRKYQPDTLSAIGSLQEGTTGQPGYFPSSDAEAAPKNTSCLTNGLMVGGILTILLACGIAFLFTLAQMDQPENWQGFFWVMALCPLPLIVTGLIMSLIGFGMRRKRETVAE